MAIQMKIPGGRIGKSEIASVEGQLGARFPEDYKQFLLDFNGGTPEANAFDVQATKTSSGVNLFYGVFGEAKDGSLMHEQRFFPNRLPSGIVAIADAAGGNRICLSLRVEDYGAIYFWDHELESEGNPNNALAQLATSFGAFFAALRRFDPQSVELRPGQVKKVWIDPDFLKKFKK